MSISKDSNVVNDLLEKILNVRNYIRNYIIKNKMTLVVKCDIIASKKSK